MSRPRSFKVATLAGDGIGPEVVDAALPVITRAAQQARADLAWERLPFGADHYLKTRETLPDSAFAHLRDDVDAIFLGAMGDPRVPGNEHARDILLGLRFRLDLYVNFRPCTLLHPDLCPLRPAPGQPAGRAIDFVIFRENTEGVYLARGSSRDIGTPDEVQVADEIHTARGVERIIRAAFDWAKANGRTRVTMSDKSNAVPAHQLWQRLFAQVGESFPTIQREHRYIDALAMELVREPERFQVIVTQQSLRRHPVRSGRRAGRRAGLGGQRQSPSRPGGTVRASPRLGTATQGQRGGKPHGRDSDRRVDARAARVAEPARRFESGVRAALAAGIKTPDLAGRASTQEVATWIDQWVANE